MYVAYRKEQQVETKSNMCGLDRSGKKESGEGTATSNVDAELPEDEYESNPVRQLHAGKTSEDQFKWTRTHGFFLQMGGFMLHENGRPKHVLGWNDIMEHYKAVRIDLSDVTTQLELTTASLALLSLFVYVLLWNKPQFNAEVPIAIVVLDLRAGVLTNESTRGNHEDAKGERLRSAFW